jgi:putative nucleotidyltransferase with HDIG domain
MGMPVDTCARERIMAALDKLPPFSPVLTRLLATLADEDVSFGELAGIIETDAVLAGNLLRLVNSPLYGRISTINSVRHAVAIVGSIKIRNLVLGMSVTRRWAGARMPAKWNGRKFNEHSLAVAVLADLVVLEVRVPYPEGAFTAGLLHDIGKLLIAVALPAEFEKIHDRYASGGDTMKNCELETIGVTHAEISGAVLNRWQLPKPIREAVAYHHSPNQANGGDPHLAHIIEATDHYINNAGHGMGPYSQPHETDFEDNYHSLGLNGCILKVAEAFKTEFQAIRTFF